MSVVILRRVVISCRPPDALPDRHQCCFGYGSKHPVEDWWTVAKSAVWNLCCFLLQPCRWFEIKLIRPSVIMRTSSTLPEPCWTIRLTYPLAQSITTVCRCCMHCSAAFPPTAWYYCTVGYSRLHRGLPTQNWARRRPQLASEHRAFLSPHFAESSQNPNLNIQCIKSQSGVCQQSLSCAGVFDLIVMQPPLSLWPFISRRESSLHRTLRSGPNQNMISISSGHVGLSHFAGTHAKHDNANCRYRAHFVAPVFGLKPQGSEQIFPVLRRGVSFHASTWRDTSCNNAHIRRFWGIAPCLF